METMVRGSRKPDLQITCEDGDREADWALLEAADVTVRGYLNDALVFSGTATEISLVEGGGGINVRRVWGSGETETVGRLWIEVIVEFGSGFPQTFPADGPLRLDIVPGSSGT